MARWKACQFVGHIGYSEGISTREQRRALRRKDQKRNRARRRWQRGQTLIIFALTVTILLGMAGLVIDVARAYDLFARMQRAAEAGALAGVLYMPTYFNAARSPGDGLSAVARATSEIHKDGFGTGTASIPASNPCPTPFSSVEIAICQLSTAPSDIEVLITEHLDVTLLGEIGVTPITLTARAEAEYLPPVQIGSRENYFGDQVECSSDGTTATTTSGCSLFDGTQKHLQYFLATMNGPADLKESGDPYVYCEEGPAFLTPPSTDPNSAPPTYNGKATNHPQQTGVTNGLTGIANYCGKPNPGVTPGNPDYQPTGYDGPMTAGTAHDGGYNYAINVSPAITSASLWIFNPYYMPQDSSASVDHFQDTGSNNDYQGPMEEGIGSNYDGTHHDAPLFFFNTTFTLYKVTNLYDRSSDAKVWTQTYQPYDDMNADLAQHHCSAGTIYDPYWDGTTTPNTYYQAASIPNPGGEGNKGGCDTPPACEQPQFDSFLNATALNWNLWCNTGYSLAPGLYRLVVEVTGLPAHPTGAQYNSTLQDGYGQHAYALKLCNGSPATAINCDNGAGGTGQYTDSNLTIFGWNDVDVTVQQTLGLGSPNANIPQNSCVTNVNYKYACVDLGCIPAVYAGRTVTAQLFDPGDGSGDLYLGVVPPQAGAADVTISPPSYVTALSGPTYDGDTVIQAHYGSTGVTPFNGLWLNFTIHLKSTYSGNCPASGVGGGTYSGWFQLVYMSNNGNPGDKLAIQFNLVGSPVHLVPPVLG